MSGMYPQQQAPAATQPSNMYVLEPGHFAIVQGKTGPLLGFKQNIFPDYCFVFFSMTNCVHCTNFTPTFFQLARAFPQCGFATVNVADGNRILIQMSRGTVLPIKGVPLLVMYAKNVPYMAYNQDSRAPRDFQSIAGFITDVMAQGKGGQNGAQYRSGEQCTNPSNPNMPQYCSYAPSKDPKSTGLCDLNTAYGITQGGSNGVHREGFMLVNSNPEDSNCVDWNCSTQQF